MVSLGFENLLNSLERSAVLLLFELPFCMQACAYLFSDCTYVVLWSFGNLSPTGSCALPTIDIEPVTLSNDEQDFETVCLFICYKIRLIVFEAL